MTQNHILIVEDERAVARGLEYSLKNAGFDVTWVETGEQALRVIDDDSPHLVLLDIRLPGISGFEVCKKIRLEGHKMPVLMLTARDEELDKIMGLELGADDYVVKPYSLRELTSRIKALLRRAYGILSSQHKGQKYQFDDVTIDADRMEVTKAGNTVMLTPTEFRLLVTLVKHPNRTFSREILIETVWGYISDLGSERTVDVHMRHLREKLEDDPASPIRFITVRGVGYKFENHEE